jgi:hypothetical protein
VVVSVESTQKPDNNRSTFGLDSQLIYKELIVIGRNRRSIRPEALLDCQHLLSCAEVRRRTLGSADLMQQAKRASEALHEAIETIVIPETRAVAEVALCAIPELEGLSIGYRISTASGMDQRTFGRYRQRAFEHITAFLTRRTAVETESSLEGRGTTDPVPTDGDPNDGIGDSQTLRVIAANAQKLYYAGLGTMFVHSFDRVLQREGCGLARTEKVAHTSIGYRFFSACVDYIYSSFPPGSPPWFMDARHVDDFLRSCEHLLQAADRRTIDELATWWKIAADSTPLAFPDVTLRERASLIKSASQQYRLVHMSQEDQLRSWFPIQRRWFDWLDNVPLDIIYGPFTNKVARLVSVSGAFVQTLRQVIELNEAVDNKAREGMLAAIEDSYWRYDTSAILGGQSVIGYASQFIDDLGPVLTNRAR